MAKILLMMMKHAMPVPLMELLAIPLSNLKTIAKWLVISPTLWVKQLAIRLGCKRPQPSRWLSREQAREQTNRCASFTLKENR